MEGNVAFVSSRGIRFISMDQLETKKLMQHIEELKQAQQKGTSYRFIVSFNDQPDVECDDVWLAIGVSNGG